MSERERLVSKVLVLDGNHDCYDKIKQFCEEHNLVGIKAQEGHELLVLKSNIDLGAILMSETYGGSADGGLALAWQIHRIRPELPIFLRREKKSDLDDLDPPDQKLFSAAYTLETMDKLRDSIDASIFCLVYPNGLVRGISELTISAMASQIKDMTIEVEAPYMVRDRIIFGELFTLMPLEASWCRGYMVLQTEEEPFLRLVKGEKTSIGSGWGDNFRDINSLFGELTNLIWGAFKNRYISARQKESYKGQVPIIINHLHHYISFGSEDPQLCFKYSLTGIIGGEEVSLIIYQRFVFNLEWAPEEFQENRRAEEALFQAGEVEFF